MRLLAVGLSARALVETIASSCWKPAELLSLDYFADRDLKAHTRGAYALLRDFGYQTFGLEGLAGAVDQLSFDALVYGSGVEHYPQLVEKWSNRARVWGNNGRSLRLSRNWEYVHNALQQEGVPFPRTYYRFRGPTPPGRWLRKPRASGGGSGIDYSQPGEHVPPGFLLQEYLAGIPASVGFVADGEKGLILGLTEQLCGWSQFAAPGFLYTGNLAPLELEPGVGLPAGVWAQVQKMVDTLAAACNLRGWNGIDFLLSPRGEVWFLELNPRFSGSMELYRFLRTWDLFSMHLEANAGRLPSAGDLLPVSAGKDCFWGKGIVYAPRTLVIPATGLPPLEWLRDIPGPGEEIPGGEPLCTVLARGRSREECAANLQAKRSEVLTFLEGGAGRGSNVGRT